MTRRRWDRCFAEERSHWVVRDIGPFVLAYEVMF
jgi:hypothetical protein